MKVSSGFFHLVLGDDQASIVSYPFADVVFQPSIEVVLAAEEDLFTSRLVFEAQLVVVVRAAALGTVGLEGATGLVVG